MIKQKGKQNGLEIMGKSSGDQVTENDLSDSRGKHLNRSSIKRN